MFTGIIKDLLAVEKINNKGKLKQIGLRLLSDEQVNIGDSIALNGVCLTVTDIKNNIAFFDVVEETLNKSNLSDLKANDKVNVEYSLTPETKISGHFVTGHIDTVGHINKIKEDNDAVYFEVSYPEDFKKYIASKGSIAVDGISLTVAKCQQNFFSFYCIPHTFKNTNLHSKKEHDTVNLEFDILAKYLTRQNLPAESQSKITKDYLKEKGFL
jgi:riboflavin synthase